MLSVPCARQTYVDHVPLESQVVIIFRDWTSSDVSRNVKWCQKSLIAGQLND